MWSVVKENAHLVHLKEVTDLEKDYKWNKIWVLNKRRRGMRTSVYIWCRGKGTCLEWKLALLKCKKKWKKCCVVLSKFNWSTHGCIHGKPIQIWCWCILPTQYELILIIVRSKVFNGKGWPSWSLTSVVLNKRRRGMRTSVYIWCRGKGTCLEWKLVLLKCKKKWKKCCVVPQY
jgi:hypothetical protein